MIEWLTTIPGILILCGILLLIIAIILFVVGAKKSKSEVVTNTNSVVDNGMNTMNSNLNAFNNQFNVPNVAPVINEPVVSDVVTAAASVSQAEPVNIIPGVDLSKDNLVIEKINKIPGIELSSKAYRKFIADIKGNINNDDYVTSFQWIN